MDVVTRRPCLAAESQTKFSRGSSDIRTCFPVVAAVAGSFVLRQPACSHCPSRQATRGKREKEKKNLMLVQDENPFSTRFLRTQLESSVK